MLTTLSSKHYTPSSLLCTLHQCQNLLVFRQNTLLFKWQNFHFQGCCAIWNQSLSNIRATGERHTRRYFPRCLARENIACDVDEVLWPDRNQRQDEATFFCPFLFYIFLSFFCWRYWSIFYCLFCAKIWKNKENFFLLLYICVLFYIWVVLYYTVTIFYNRRKHTVTLNMKRHNAPDKAFILVFSHS